MVTTQNCGSKVEELLGQTWWQIIGQLDSTAVGSATWWCRRSSNKTWAIFFPPMKSITKVDSTQSTWEGNFNSSSCLRSWIMSVGQEPIPSKAGDKQGPAPQALPGFCVITLYGEFRLHPGHRSGFLRTDWIGGLGSRKARHINAGSHVSS